MKKSLSNLSIVVSNKSNDFNKLEKLRAAIAWLIGAQKDLSFDQGGRGSLVFLSQKLYIPSPQNVTSGPPEAKPMPKYDPNKLLYMAKAALRYHYSAKLSHKTDFTFAEERLSVSTALLLPNTKLVPPILPPGSTTSLPITKAQKTFIEDTTRYWRKLARTNKEILNLTAFKGADISAEISAQKVAILKLLITYAKYYDW
jgi:hypothetical protein